MTDLRPARGLSAVRRRLGFKLTVDERLLEDFVAFLERAGARITTRAGGHVGAAAGRRAPAPRGASGCRSCAGSRGISRRSIPPARSRPVDLLPARRVRGSRHTSTRAGDRCADRGRRSADAAAARARRIAGDRAAGHHRAAARRNARPRPRRRRSERRRAARAARETSIARCRCTTAPSRCFATTPAARPVLPAAGHAGVLHQQARCADHQRRFHDVSQADRAGRPGGREHSDAHTIYAIRSLSARSSTGITPALTSTGRCRCSPRFSGIPIRLEPYWYLQAVAGADGAANRRERLGGTVMTLIASTLQAWFTDRLMTQTNCSPCTIAAYRDTFRLLLRFAQQQTGKQPFELDIDDLDAPLIGAFLKHLEQDRGNSPSTRNARLGAIHSFYRFAALEHPEHAHTIARVMAIPTKRHERNTVSYLDRDEINATARRARQTHLARPPRPRAAGAHDPDRRARLRAHRAPHLSICTSAAALTSGSWGKAGKGGHRPSPARPSKSCARG